MSDSPGSLAPPAPPEVQDPSLFVNRELSLLAFQWRVLEEARDPANPLLERVKFLAIVSSNLDEFFMVRVGGLLRQAAAGVAEMAPDGMTPSEQLAAIRQQIVALRAAMRACLAELRPALAAAGIHLLALDDLSGRQKQRLGRYFQEVVYPVLTPLAFDPGRPFPHISNLSLSLAILIHAGRGGERFARLKVPGTLPRLVPIEADATGSREHAFVWLEQLVAEHLDALFPGMRVVEAHPFQVIRDADLAIRELEADDLLESVEESVRRRRFRAVVRLAIESGMPPGLRDTLVRNLGIDEAQVYVCDGPLALSGLKALHDVDRPDLKDPAFSPRLPPELSRGGSLFAAIRRGDVLLHHPYDSFAPVVALVKQASRDPRVLALKQTLYRTGKDSPVVEALLEAPERGKEVAVLVELKARFDEESNIEWARALEREGVHVIYGLVGLKTHAKVALVVRKEGKRIRRYVHLSTGNYNANSAQFYTDLGLLTCDEAIGADATDLFNYLTGYSAKTEYRKLLVAPINLRSRFEELIRREMERARSGGAGRLIFKMNSLADPRMIALLYRASQAGVEVDLIVRGICCLRPGVPGVSERIRVRSIVGRFLEHSRIYYFGNGGAEDVYLGSADLMMRNLDRRVEALFPIERPELVSRLRRVLELMLADNVKAREMRPDGSYLRVARGPGDEAIDSQAQLMAGGGV